MKPKRPTGPRYAGRTLAAISVATFILGPLQWTSRADEQPPAGTITRIASVPNHFSVIDDVAPGAGVLPSSQTFLLADPDRRLLITAGSYDYGRAYPNAGDCKTPTAPPPVTVVWPAEWVAYDLDSYQIVDIACGLPSPDAQSSLYTPLDTLTPVVDRTSSTMFLPCLCGTAPGYDGQTIAAVSERPLRFAADFCLIWVPGDTCAKVPTATTGDLSAQPLPYLHSLSWYKPTDDLIAVTDSFKPTYATAQSAFESPTTPLGLAVTDYHVTHASTGQLGLTLEWTVHLGPQYCVRALADMQSVGGAAYRSEDPTDQALFVPCVNRQDAQQPDGTSVVKILLGRDGAPAGDPLTDPSVAVQALPAPFAGQDFLFDPVVERGYLLPFQAAANGTTIAVYDGGGRGQPGSFIGRQLVAHAGGSAYALDPATGRLYVDAPISDGVVTMDGRRSTLSTEPFAALRTGMGTGTYAAAVAPPDNAYPFTRVFLPNITNFLAYHSAGQVYEKPEMRSITVAADRVEISQDPPVNALDKNTASGPIPQGAEVSATYGGNASGYGVHLVAVGGYWGTADNAATNGGGPAPPYGRTTFDYEAGAVQGSSLRDGSAQASSSSLFDLNGNGARAYRNCTDVYSPQSCQAPPDCPVSGSTDPCGALFAAAQNAAPTPSSTTQQQWPYPIAECSDPGPPDQQGRHTVNGVQYSPQHSATASPAPPTPTAAPSSSDAMAVADCTPGQSSGYAQLACRGVAQPSMPSPSASASPAPPSTECTTANGPQTLGSPEAGEAIDVVNASASTHVQPPSDGQVTSYASASAQGVHITLPNGATLDINQVVQTAKAWTRGSAQTAHTIRQVTLQGITIQSPNQAATTLCEHPCSGSQALLDQLNALDPSNLFVLLPQPDETYGVEPDGVSPSGSPGGYIAQVIASLAEQRGDAAFNQMHGFQNTEQTVLPALRIIINEPGDVTVSRTIVDLAGVEADVQLGIQVLDDGSGDFGGGGGTVVDNTEAMIAAGVPPVANYQPGTPGFPGQPAAAPYAGGPLGLIERTLDGLGWLLRSPFGGLQMAGFLVLLGLPLTLARRRWSWRPAPLKREG